MRFKYFKSRKNEQWYFHIVAPNGELIAASEGYKRKGDCLKAIDMIRRAAADAPVGISAT